MFDDLLMFFNSFRNAKSLTVFSHVVRLLTLFPNELATKCSPFWGLKCLKLDFTSQSLFEEECSLFFELLKLVPVLKAYLLHKSHDAKCIITKPPVLCKSIQCLCGSWQQN